MRIKDLRSAGDCTRCKRSMVLQKDWYALTRKQRKSVWGKIRCLAARGLCHPCYETIRYKNPDDLLDYERKTVPLAVFAEEYRTLHDSGSTDQHIAEMVGLFRPNSAIPSKRMATFEKALERAKKAGLL